MAKRRILGIGDLGLRLALVFVAVSLTAIVAEAAIGAVGVAIDVSAVVRQQEASLARDAALSAAAAYQGAGWARADLRPVLEVASRSGAAVQVRDSAGRVVGVSPRYARYQAAGARTVPVISRRPKVGSASTKVGQVTVRFGPVGPGTLSRKFASERLRARLIAAVIAVLVALVVSVAVARWITAPIEVMLATMRRRGAGDRGIRIKKMRGTGVLRELQQGFNDTNDALDERDRLQRNLVADVAHEVRTPVAILRAGHEAMLDGVTDLTRENITSLRDEVLRLSDMLEDLQRLAAAEAAALQLRKTLCDLASVAGETAAGLEASFEAAGVTLESRLSGAQVRCDAARMREVITNLLTNAMKFTPAGGRVVLETGPGGKHTVRLQVSDTGIGIAADELPHVTERFFRGRRSAEIAPGSGIGMTIVTELVRAHRGQLHISSEEGVGTRVTVTLPAAGHA
jgi:two-component system sensor histidine kinase BaeS